MGLSPSNAGLRGRSGAADSNDPLVASLYQLLRDHLPAGAVEGIIQKHVLVDGHPELETSEFCDGYIAHYAMDIASRLRPYFETEAERQFRNVLEQIAGRRGGLTLPNRILAEQVLDRFPRGAKVGPPSPPPAPPVPAHPKNPFRPDTPTFVLYGNMDGIPR